jgi:DNA polymerase-3 subunit epsilon/oligoribonuclease
VRGIFLDTETNGLNAFIHRVLEIAFKIVDLATGKVVDHYSTVVHISENDWAKSDPVSLQINGFTYALSEEGVPASEVSIAITNLLQKNHIGRDNAVFICQNPSFDRIFFSQLINPEIQESFKWPYHWLDLASMYWAEAMRAGRLDPLKLPWKTGLSKNKIALTYNLPPEESPHRAMNGVDHLILCYERVIGYNG